MRDRVRYPAALARILLLTCAALLTLVTSASDAVASGRPTVARPTGAPTIAADVDSLSSGAMQGRRAGTPGAKRARGFLLSRLAATAVKPVLAGGFQQRFVSPSGDTLVNLVALLPAAESSGLSGHVLVGAHYDHLGVGGHDDPHPGQMYPGADDNASGVAALLELAATCEPRQRDVLLLFFDGEEEGRLGSRYYVQHPALPLAEAIAMVNFDTVGRLTDDRLTVFGSATAAELENVLRGVNVSTRFTLQLVGPSSGASDDLSFVERGVPSIQLFTGANPDYHRPSDTPDKVNVQGLARVAAFASELVGYLSDRDTPLTFVPPGAQRAAEGAAAGGPRRRVSFGSIPDFQRQSGGVLLTGVLPQSPAERAGLQAGDILVEFGGTPVDNLADYSDAMKRFAPGDKVDVVYLRGAERHTVTVTLVERN